MKSGAVRSERKPRHGWFDYEVLDVFGDELEPYGITVYMVLARLCYGGFRVTMGVRELAAHARMSKDSLSRTLKRMVELGLVVEHKGRTPKSASSYDLMDVKDLVEETRAAAKLLRQAPKSVSHGDSGDRDASVGAQDTLVHLILTNRPATSGARPLGSPGELEGAEELEAADELPDGDGDCLPQRQIFSPGVKGVEKPGNGSAAATDLSQNDPRFETDLSLPAVPSNYKKQETRNKNTPLPPASGGSASPPTAAEAEGNGESKKLPHEGQGQGDRPAEIAAQLRAATPADKLEAQLVWASARVMRAHDFAPDVRVEEAISEALGRWCQKTGGTVEAAVALEDANFRVYQEHSFLMTYGWGWRWWFKRGFWANQALWPIDKQRAAQMQRGAVGRNPS